MDGFYILSLEPHDEKRLRNCLEEVCPNAESLRTFIIDAVQYQEIKKYCRKSNDMRLLAIINEAIRVPYPEKEMLR